VGGVDPLEAKLAQRQAAEIAGCDRHGVDGRTDIMQESRQRKLSGARSTSWFVRGFEHGDRVTGAGEFDGGSKPIGSGADHQRVIGELWQNGTTSQS